jgi:hypothetical protein
LAEGGLPGMLLFAKGLKGNLEDAHENEISGDVEE